MKTRNTHIMQNHIQHRHRHRGSILLLVIGVLLLLMVLGTAYIQLVRKDRESVFNLSSSRRIGQVAQSTMDAVAARLKEDIVHDNSTPDNPDDDVFFSEIPIDSQQGPQENYDYPGRFDRWLASTGPNRSNRWGQISLVGDRYAFLELNTQVPNIAGAQSRHYNPPTVPVDEYRLQQNFQIFSTLQLLNVDRAQIDNHTPAPLNVNLNADSLDPRNEEFGILADADGDGFYDSIWEVAPIPQMHGKRYFAAYRVIDNSSMVNAQVGLGAGHIIFGTPYAGTFETWSTPADSDFTRYMAFKSPTGGGQNAPDNPPNGVISYIPYRVLNANLSASGGTSPLLRKTFWDNAGVYTGQLPPLSSQNFNMLGIENELELRYRNGLNNENITTTLESFFPSMLRANSPGEIAYHNLPITILWTSGFTGQGNYSGKLKQYYDNNPRVGITTISGASTLVEPFQKVSDSIGSTQIPRQLRMAKSDLNKASLEEIYEQALLIYAQGTPYIHMNGYDSAAFAKQFAVNVMDYRDQDNMITQYKGDDIFGMEALPFVTEIYSVQAYKAENVTPSGDPMNPTGFNVQWGAEGNAGVAIEIYNPFGHAIETKNVFVEVNGQELGELNTLSGVSSIEPGKFVVLYKAAEGPEGDLSATFNMDKVQEVKDITTDVPPGTTIKVRLLVNSADEGGGVKEKIAYCSANLNQTHPPVHNETNVPLDPDPNSMTIYKQMTATGNARGMNAMLIAGDNFRPAERGPSHAVAFKADYHNIGKVQKSSEAAQVVDPDRNQLIFGRFHEENAQNEIGFALIGELAHLPIIGPNKNRTFAQMWTQLKDQSRDSGCMLNFEVSQTELVLPSGNSGAYYPNIGDNTHALPHAMLLLNRFTTLSPLHDSKDNDQDGLLDIADEDETLVPGLININTATEDVLMSGLPWPDRKQVLEATIFRDFINYRDNPQSRPRYRNGSEFYGGFASIGELYGINSFGYYGDNSGRDEEVNSVRINPKDGMRYTDGEDEVGNDREERTMAAQWLSQLGTVRSDIFTAYILVRGYQTRDQVPRFRDAVEEIRLIAVFDRSPVRNGTGSVRVLGVYRY